jgi:hypothetical protein
MLRAVLYPLRPKAKLLRYILTNISRLTIARFIHEWVQLLLFWTHFRNSRNHEGFGLYRIANSYKGYSGTSFVEFKCTSCDFIDSYNLVLK